MYQAKIQPVAYVVSFGSRPCAVSVFWYSWTNGSLASAGSFTSLKVWIM